MLRPWLMTFVLHFGILFELFGFELAQHPRERGINPLEQAGGATLSAGIARSMRARGGALKSTGKAASSSPSVPKALTTRSAPLASDSRELAGSVFDSVRSAFVCLRIAEPLLGAQIAIEGSDFQACRR